MNNGPVTAPEQTKDLLHEAFELYNLETSSNSSLLDYGLNLGFIEKRPNGGRLTIELLNTYPMSTNKLLENLLAELLMRLGIFIPATSLVKMAIDLDNESPDREDTIKCLYILSIILHQVVNFDETSLRTLNRLLMCVAIILFSVTTMDSKPCEDMRKFKQKIKRRLLIDYYLWALMFAMSFVLTCASPILVNLEYAAGIERHICQHLLTLYCTVHLCYAMRSIGYGRLVPLIFGTPLLFIDAGDDITIAKTMVLATNYFGFWLSDWRELVDWNHSMLCEAGICKILNSEPGNLQTRFKKAKTKFDEWRMEEGLDDDGWFILLDTPVVNPTTSGTNARSQDTGGSSPARQQDEDSDSNVDVSASPGRGGDSGSDEPDDGEQGDDALHDQQLVDYSDRVIYLQSRNPLLTSLAAVLLIVWK